jgi:hypothetical protein
MKVLLLTIVAGLTVAILLNVMTHSLNRDIVAQKNKHKMEVINAILNIKVHTITIIDGDTIQDFKKPLFTKKKF